MAINKNFVVKNGIEIATDLIYADTTLNKVGFGTTLPQTKLDVVGDIHSDGYIDASGSVRGNDGLFTGFTTATTGLNVGVGGSALTVKYYPGGNRIGINTDNPRYTLDIQSGAGQTAIYLDGDIITTGNVVASAFDGSIAAGGTAGFTDLNITGIITANNRELFTEFDIINNGTVAYQYQSTGIGFTQNRDNPAIYLNRGVNYRFNVNAVGSPFYIKTARGTGVANLYNDGVENNGVQVGILTFRVPFNSPKVLYYQSLSNASMGSTIYVLDQGAGINTNTFVASNLDITGNAVISGIATIAQLNATGNATIGGNTTITGNISATGNSTIGGNSTITGISTVGRLEVTGESEVGGTLSVVGVTTFANNVFINSNASITGVVTASSFVGNFVGNITGTASSATILQTARNINGVAFNGSADIIVDPYVDSDDSTNLDRYIIFADDTTAGDTERLYESINFKYNPSLDKVTASIFAGALQGNASSATNSVNAINATNVTLADESTITTCFPLFSTAATGNQAPKTDASALTYDASTGTLTAVNLNSTSDITLKKDIEVITNAVDILKQINGVKFTWIVTGRKSAGVIAQEVEAVLPELIAQRDDNGIKSVNYDGLVGVLIEAVKELSARVEQLESKVV